ncbi:cytochrome ubiquinol oxidase subunit I [Nocardioides rotundus]|uniref:cytochrome ubiquinol oxidase subunit I n=1 Tax=Nocardioides rotundus TaxID=1774216 RepID=UPI001CBF1E9F|nr:cytochrome ubiquinol oxidase subunit I [Nocardioides rotundus]UAL31205.1 cytochrome ubiquinol oxidase subunit I [Nocardioides rotundus]
MDVLEIARWQFGIITVYHFLFVPLTIGLTLLIAIMETLWVRTRREEWLRLTKFFGKLFLINFAIGVATGIVQEFQFGMNWSDYSRFVGDIFGAPLAVEALLAFFLESTFIGLWIFGWDRLPRGLHAACMWIVHVGTLVSSWFILAANSWMQNPVGYTYNPDTGRAELADFWGVMVNKVQLVTFPHVILSAYLTAGVFMVGVAAWLFLRKPEDRPLYRKAIRFGAVAALIAGIGVAVSGDIQGKIMTEVQPMKMAAAEGLYETTENAPFSVLSIGRLDGSEATNIIEIPGLLSFLGTGSFDGEVQGINDLRAEYRAEYGEDPGAAYYTPQDYVPIIPVTYWSFRLMIGLGLGAAAGAAVLLWLTRGGRTPTSRWFGIVGLSLPIAAVAANSFGWIFTEMGRQPWVVFGLMTTERGVSPGVSVTEAWISLASLTALYGVLAVIELGLLKTYIQRGADPFEEPPTVPVGGDQDDDAPLAFAY